MREVIPRRGPTCWLALGRRPKTSRKTLHSLAAFLGKSVTEVRPTASCAEKRLVGRTSSHSPEGTPGECLRRRARSQRREPGEVATAACPALLGRRGRLLQLVE